MTFLEQRIKTFFEYEIFDLAEDEVDTFLNNYSSKIVIECLIEKLKSLSYGDDAWKLGRVFCYISKKHAADTQVYSLFNASTLAEKELFLNFLLGYWSGTTDVNLEIVVNLAEEITNIIASPDDWRWNKELISIAIEAIGVGYVNNEQLFKASKNIDNQITQRLKIIKNYILDNVDFHDSYHQLILGLSFED